MHRCNSDLVCGLERADGCRGRVGMTHRDSSRIDLQGSLMIGREPHVRRQQTRMRLFHQQQMQEASRLSEA